MVAVVTVRVTVDHHLLVAKVIVVLVAVQVVVPIVAVVARMKRDESVVKKIKALCN